MPLAATVIWEVQPAASGGSDNNGGGFDAVSGTPGTDYTQGAGQAVRSWLAAAGTHTNDLSISNANPSVVSSASYNFVAADVGNIINLTAGTNVTAGRYQIVSVGSNQATLDRNAMTGAPSNDASGYLGGALATWGMLGKVIKDAAVSGQQGFIKYSATAYAITDANPNVTGGYLALDITVNHSCYISGYNTTRTLGNDDALRPTVQCSGVDPAYMCRLQNGTDTRTQFVGCIIFDVNGRTPGTAVCGAPSQEWAEAIYFNCEVIGDDNAVTGFVLGTTISCIARQCSTAGYTAQYSSYCVAIGCGNGWILSNNQLSHTVHCVAYSCTIGFNNGSKFTDCSAVGCSSHGFVADSGDGSLYVNCLSIESSGGNGFYQSSGAMVLINCATGDNSSGRESGATLDIGAINLPANGTYVEDAANGDFRLKAFADGALAKAAATYIRTSANNKTQDIGAVQHADPAGGGGGGPLVGPSALISV